MTCEQLAEFIQQGGNEELLPLLWDKTRILIYKKCAQFWQFYGERLTLHGYSLDDFKQEGYNALLLAVKGYNGAKEYKFTTYLNYALKRILRGLLSGGSDVLNQSGTESLNKPLGESSDGEPLLVGDIVPDERAVAAYEDIERLDEYTILYEAIDALPSELRDVIRTYYFEGLTYQRIGELHGYSADRARQIVRVALQRLRNNPKVRAAYAEDYTCHSIRHKGLAAFLSSGSSEIEDYVMRQWGNYSPPK